MRQVVTLNTDPKVYLDEEEVTEGKIVTQCVFDGDILDGTRISVAVRLDKPEVGITVGVKNATWIKGQVPEIYDALIPYVTSNMEDIKELRDTLDAALQHYEAMKAQE